MLFEKRLEIGYIRAILLVLFFEGVGCGEVSANKARLIEKKVVRENLFLVSAREEVVKIIVGRRPPGPSGKTLECRAVFPVDPIVLCDKGAVFVPAVPNKCRVRALLQDPAALLSKSITVKPVKSLRDGDQIDAPFGQGGVLGARRRGGKKKIFPEVLLGDAAHVGIGLDREDASAFFEELAGQYACAGADIRDDALFVDLRFHEKVFDEFPRVGRAEFRVDIAFAVEFSFVHSRYLRLNYSVIEWGSGRSFTFQI